MSLAHLRQDRGLVAPQGSREKVPSLKSSLSPLEGQHFLNLCIVQCNKKDTGLIVRELLPTVIYLIPPESHGTDKEASLGLSSRFFNSDFQRLVSTKIQMSGLQR
jgi:hypothetical protein